MKKIFVFIIIFLHCDFVFAKEIEIHQIKIIEHKFIPDTIIASPDKILKLHIFNEDSTVEEFESFDLKREKIVPGNKKIIVVVGPLKPGEYHFFGEFHPDTAQGKIIVK